jgi:hypothetical protein
MRLLRGFNYEDADEEARQRWCHEVRNLASEAFAQGNYILASEAYHAILWRVEFTDVEKRQKKIAQRCEEKSLYVFNEDEMPQ